MLNSQNKTISKTTMSAILSNHINMKKVLECYVLDCFNEDFSISLSKEDIKEKIEKEKGIKILDTEMSAILKDSNIVIKNADKYRLSLSASNEVNDRVDIDSLLRDIFKDSMFEDDIYIDTIYRFLYSIFYEQFSNLFYAIPKSGEKSVISIANEQIKNSKTDNYSDNEIEAINYFIEYKSVDKDKLIFDLIIKATEFMSIAGSGVKDFDKSSLANRKLFLDSNVLIRAIGLNGADRKNNIIDFLSILKDSGLKFEFYITNITYDEAKSSIRGICLNINSTPYIGKVRPEQHFYYNDSSTKAYIQWKKTRIGNTVNDFLQFNNMQLSNLLTDYNIKIISVDNYPLTKQYDLDLESRFKFYYEKNQERNITRSLESAGIDIANIKHIQKKRNYSKDLRSSSYFLITCDSYLINFCRNESTIENSLSFLPSFWLALVIKFSGRNVKEDTLHSFSQFLKIKNRNNHFNEEIITKTLAIVNEVVESLPTANKCLDYILDDMTRKDMLVLTNENEEEHYNLVTSNIEKLSENIEEINLKIETVEEELKQAKEKQKNLQAKLNTQKDKEIKRVQQKQEDDYQRNVKNVKKNYKLQVISVIFISVILVLYFLYMICIDSGIIQEINIIPNIKNYFFSRKVFEESGNNLTIYMAFIEFVIISIVTILLKRISKSKKSKLNHLNKYRGL